MDVPDQEVAIARLVEEIKEAFPEIQDEVLEQESLRIAPPYEAYCMECGSVIEGMTQEEYNQDVLHYCKGCCERDNDIIE